MISVLQLEYKWRIFKVENEKVSVNVNNAKLAAIDLLVDEDLVANRSAFINEAIDLLLQKKQKLIDDIIAQRQKNLSSKQWFIGLQSIDRDYLIQYKNCGVKIKFKGFGSLYLRKDIESVLLYDTIESISKRIKIHGTEEQVKILKEKIIK